MLLLDDFYYCTTTNTRYIDLIFGNLFLSSTLDFIVFKCQ